MHIGAYMNVHISGENAREALTAEVSGERGQDPQIRIGGTACGVHLVMGIEEAAILLESLDQALSEAQERHLRLVMTRPPV